MKQSPPPFIQMGRFTVTLTQALTLGVVLILVGGILSVKSYQAAGETADSAAVAIKTAEEAAAVTPNIFLEAVTNSPEKELPVVNTPPESQFDQHLAAGKPIVAFFHSNDCVQCVKMIEVVEQVYPDFAARVALVDVNVYDRQDQNLLRRTGIRAIPTMIFIDAAGQGQAVIGQMAVGDFRGQLQRISGE